jgi:hypothetical protein
LKGLVGGTREALIELSKAEISKYLKIINNKMDDYANYINDNNLSEISIKHFKVTYFDIILS